MMIFSTVHTYVLKYPLSKNEIILGLALLTLSWDKNWYSHSLVNGYPSLYPRIALVAPSPEEYFLSHCGHVVDGERCFVDTVTVDGGRDGMDKGTVP